jgi:hypothetical protein
MAHYALLNEENIVEMVITGKDEDDLVDGVESWEDFYGEFHGMRCLRTSYNTLGNEHILGGEPFRGNYAGIGFEYREDLDVFVEPKPFNSWTLNEETFIWEAPIPYPEDGADYTWDEDNASWKLLSTISE